MEGRKYKMTDRQEFLLKMYETTWHNIARTDEALWRFFIAYVTVVVAALFLSDKYINDIYYGLIIAVFITAVATCYSFNVNLWFLRNVLIIGNLEASFLDANDYGKIIPANWKPPYLGKFINLKEFPTILGFIYPAFAVLMAEHYWGRLCDDQKGFLRIYFVIVSIAAVVYISFLNKQFNELKRDAPGPQST
jgi:hypothetical protein